MIRAKRHHRKPDLLLLLVAIVVLCAVMTSAATSGELFNFFPKPQSTYRLQPLESGLTVASMGHTSVGVHVSLRPPRELPQEFLKGGESTPKQEEVLSQVFLFLRYPW